MTNVVAVFIQAADTTAYDLLSSQLQAIKSISGKNASAIVILNHEAPTPTSCAVHVVASSAAVFLKLNLQDDTALTEEITKLQTKLEKVAESVAKQRQLIDSLSEFKHKIDAGVQEEAENKLQGLLTLRENYEKTVSQFREMKVWGKDA
jgi:intracellular sulfur oxidation DsrE/DsrF family protein